MPHGRRVKPIASAAPEQPVLRSFQICTSGHPARTTITRQRLYASGREVRELIGTYSPEQAAQAVGELLLQG